MPTSNSKLTKLNFIPGFHQESTQYAEEGKWYEGNRVRFREGKPENIRGYQKKTSTPLIGTTRAIHTWANNNTEKLLANGTEQRLNLLYNDLHYDITPITTVVSVSAPGDGNFNTTAGSSLILISVTNHNVSVRDWIAFSSTSINGFGTPGVDFSTSAYGGPTFQVVSTSGLNNFFISVTSVAVSTETNQGNGTLSYLLETESTDNIQGLGYGAGIYDAGASTTGERAWSDAAETSNIIFQANQWSMDNWGEDLLAVRRGGQLMVWDADASVAPVRATLVVTAPDEINSIVVSPNDRHVIALGTKEYGTGIFNPLLVRWSDQEDYTNWTPSATTTSGEIQLVDGTAIAGGIRTRNAIHIWTDRALYGLQFVGPPFIFQTQLLGDNAGLIGPHAAIELEGVTYWMGYNDFFAFNGRVQKLNCTVRRFIYDSFHMAQADKVYCGTNSEFHEVIWLYPANDSLEPNRYVIYNTLEDHWVFGEGIFTTFEDRNTFNNTITTGRVSATASPYFWDNELPDVYTGDGQILTSYIKSADFDIEDGDELMFMDRLIPDYSLDSGSIQITLQTKEYPSGSTITKGPYTIDNSTRKIDFRARGRQAAITVSSSDSVATDWRWGSLRLAIKPDGRR